MHDTALKTGQAFFKCYGEKGCSILDVGSQDVNGSLRPFIPEGAKYWGVDISPGPNVDQVIRAGSLPFDQDSFDLVVSTSCFEHDPQFWVTFYEMCRVVRRGGFVYISAPSNGPVHRHPIDCWRFYPDSAVALAAWVTQAGDMIIDVVENFRMSPSRDGWTDQVNIFRKYVHTLDPRARSCQSIREYIAL
jgi:SAM-dependent methyltransferase